MARPMPFGARFPTFEELGVHLAETARRHPDLVSVDAVRRTHQGREIWLVTLTDRRTGSPDDKPAVYMDGNIHAEELTAGAAVVYLLDRLLAEQASSERIQRLLARRTFYLMPRANPDGAHVVQTTPYPWVGNGRRRPPLIPDHGLYYEDVDGDGLVLWMRQVDPRGEWQISERDPRLMIPRGPADQGGTFYRLYPEGRIVGYDGASVLIPRPDDGNLNRHFPADWDPDEYGGGPIPLSEPESRAIAETLLAHPNIGAALSCHTHSGVLLPPDPPSETPMPYEDAQLYKAINAMGEAATGYPTVSVLRGFTVPGMPRRHGVFNDWCYAHLGLIAYTIELWDAEREAGIDKQEHVPFHPLTEDQQWRLLRWNDEALGGDGFVRWRPFTHPELGPVEIGGWKSIQVFRNPPTDALLERELEKVYRFAVGVAESLPELRLGWARAQAVAEDLYIVDAAVTNDGFAPTSVTTVGARRGAAPRAELTLEGGMTLLMGDAVQTVPHLSGRAERPVPWNPWTRQWRPDSHRVQWLVRAPRGGTVSLTIRAPQAGVTRTALVLKTQAGHR